MRLVTRLALLALLGVLSACESASDRALRNSPDFKAGYSDGCASAGTQGANMRDTSSQRDEEAYRANPAYRTGWGAGFSTCRNYQSPTSGPPMPGQGPIPDPHPF